MKRLLIIPLLFFTCKTGLAQEPGTVGPLAHTFSVIARDARTGEMAVGVQSHWFSVGTLVSWGKSGVGVVATQSFVNPAFGPDGIRLMEEGNDAKKTLEMLIAGDSGRDGRQLAILDIHGNVASYTGKKCIQSANNITGDNYSVQANMMLNDKVVPAMAKAFESSAGMPLAERVLKTLWAGQEAGGDIRGKQSAVLIIVNGERVKNPWMDKKIDLRVEDSAEPLKELERLLTIHHAYEHMNNGDLAVEHGDMVLALKEYGAAEAMVPGNLEMKFWKAIALANNGRLEEAVPILKLVFKEDMNWKELTRRLPSVGLLNLGQADLERILKL
jgi:uncharacterized Ntn-hydrolase superfamily protein